MITPVLVEPKYQGNIGACARAAKNFGFEKMAIVKGPKTGSEAKKYSMHALDVLKNAKRYKSFDEMLSDFDYLVACTGISAGHDENFKRIGCTPRELKQKMALMKGRIGLVFGREDNGLTNEEIEKCDIVVTIPTDERYPSMNLSHALAVVLYELSDTEKGKIRLATRKETSKIEEMTGKLIDKTGMQKKKTVGLIVRRILARAVLSGREAHTLAGLLREINSKIKKRTKSINSAQGLE